MLTNESDFCRLYNSAGTAFHKLAANLVYAHSLLQAGIILNDRSSYNHALAPLTITNQTPTSTAVFNDS